MSSERTFCSPTRCTSSNVPVGSANRQGGSADMRDSRTYHELADKEFSTATCRNVVGAPWPCSTRGDPDNICVTVG